MMPINKWWPFESIYDLILEIYYQFQEGYIFVWWLDNGVWSHFYAKKNPEGFITHSGHTWRVRTLRYYNKFPILIVVSGHSESEEFDMSSGQVITDTELYQKFDTNDIRCMIESVIKTDIDRYIAWIGAGAAVICLLYLMGTIEIKSIKIVSDQVQSVYNLVNSTR